MKKLFIFLLLGLFVINFSSASYSSCYQESANVSNQPTNYFTNNTTLIPSDGNCNLVYNGSYSYNSNFLAPQNYTDGDWFSLTGVTNPSTATFYVNYTKPTSSFNATWAFKDWIAVGPPTTYNKSIPSSCFNAYPNTLSFQINSTQPTTITRYYCWNGASWTQVFADGTQGPVLYEEAVFWNITDLNISNIEGNGTNNYGTLNQNKTINFTVNSSNLSYCWIQYNGTNHSVGTCTSGNQYNTTFTLQQGLYTGIIWANDTFGVTINQNVTWNYRVFENSISYTNPILAGSLDTIVGNFTLSGTISNITLIYNGTTYIPSVNSSGSNYLVSYPISIPSVSVNTNLSFFYNFSIDGNIINSQTKNQTIQTVGITTNCGGNYSFINISNYNEETLLPFNGTVEYTIILYNNNLQLGVANGSFTNTTQQICTTQNITSSSSTYSIQLRYYDLNGSYVYKTYNIQNDPSYNVPLNVSLYFLNSSIGTTFNIQYVDFDYITHPNALIYIQRNYLTLNEYKTVEIPIIGNDGLASGSFNANNVKYKLIIVENGTILDVFDNIFPRCQSVVTGVCNIPLRGNQSTSSSSNGDFTYTLDIEDNNLTLTYVIPSGTPRSIFFQTNQSSRFIQSITTCNQTQFASSGTLICTFNDTVGDSLINVQIDISGEDSIFGTIHVSEDLSSFFALNNYFIAFFLLLTLMLIFISSGIALVIMTVFGIIYLGTIFLFRGVSIGTISLSIVWLIVAAGLIIYKLNQKEERNG